MSTTPTGEEREVKSLGGANIDGAPVAYIVVLAAVTTALAFIPFSVVMALGGSFPMSQGIYSLTGWILGPIAGAVASGIGALIGVFLAPHTAGVPAVSVYGAIVGSFAGGAMVIGNKRKNWWIPLAVLFIIEYLLYIGQAMFVNGVSVGAVISATFINWSSLLLWILPTRTLFARWVNSQNLGWVAAGLFLGTWMVYGVAHTSQTVITYYMFNWPEEVWWTLTGIIPVENLFRCLIATVIGTGVIAGLRATGIVKPSEAIY